MKLKQNIEEKYKKDIEANKSEPYSKCIMDCMEIMGNEIDNGALFDNAEEAMLKTPDGQELTGFMMGAIVSGLAHYHERGDEIKVWWNNKSGGTPDESGVKNPAIVTIG